ncbi:unnamed protein product [Cylicocyclus nassatus]|uniref:Uncharacterized protein n=1 Tax=Cylicocyclus nassatus TaxID=53992 RepID=A0AA36HB90_CYLNA|nr:unnamed protein product [Cylicocyclus nassatus]
MSKAHSRADADINIVVVGALRQLLRTPRASGPRASLPSILLLLAYFLIVYRSELSDLEEKCPNSRKMMSMKTSLLNLSSRRLLVTDARALHTSCTSAKDDPQKKREESRKLAEADEDAAISHQNVKQPGATDVAKEKYPSGNVSESYEKTREAMARNTGYGKGKPLKKSDHKEYKSNEDSEVKHE